EWLLLPDGRIVKADALEHCRGHDCIGPQDLMWDVVAAGIELNMNEAEQQTVEEQLARHGLLRPDPFLRSFYRQCYLAFQMGYYVLAAQAHAQSPDEAERLRTMAERYG